MNIGNAKNAIGVKDLSFDWATFLFGVWLIIVVPRLIELERKKKEVKGVDRVL